MPGLLTPEAPTPPHTGLLVSAEVAHGAVLKVFENIAK